MNKSNMTYSEAVEVVSKPESYSQAKKLFMAVDISLAVMLFVPLISFVAITLVWSLIEDHKYKKLWNNGDFWLALIILIVMELGMLIFAPYLFMQLV